MTDMRLDDLITIVVTLAKLVVLLFGVMAVIAFWPRIVSILSRIKQHMADEGAARRAYRYDRYAMSSQGRSHIYDPVIGSHYSDAAEHTWEPLGTGDGNSVPALWEQLGTLSDDALLDIFARIKTPSGEYKYVDSRIAKFIGGRVEDRIDQVRKVRGIEPPSVPAGRQLRVRDAEGERLIPMDV